MSNKFDALQNAVNSIGMQGLKLTLKPEHDKRKTAERFLLSLNGMCISPVLDYDKMNHFLLGFSCANQILSPITPPAKPKYFGQKTDTERYLEWVNEWLTVKGMAENYGRTEAEMLEIIEKGKAEHLEKFEPQELTHPRHKTPLI